MKPCWKRSTALKPLLAKRLQNPHVPGALLHRELAGCYKIKLLKQGWRLVYVVEDDELFVLVLSLAKRESSTALLAAAKRIKEALIKSSVRGELCRTMNGGVNQINGLSELPFDKLRANGLIQSFLK